MARSAMRFSHTELCPCSAPCSRRSRSTSAMTETGGGTKQKAQHLRAPSHSYPRAADMAQSGALRGNPGHCYGNAPPHPGCALTTRRGPAAPSLPHGPRRQKVLEALGSARAWDPPGDIYLRVALREAHGAPSGPSGGYDRGVTPQFCSVKPNGFPGPGSHRVPAEGLSRAGLAGPQLPTTPAQPSGTSS